MTDSRQPSVPPIVHAPHVLTNLSAAEILLTFGQTRLVIGDDDNGTSPSLAMREWHCTVAMSPTAAHSLLKTLEATLMRYQERFGPITEDAELINRIVKKDFAATTPVQ